MKHKIRVNTRETIHFDTFIRKPQYMYSYMYRYYDPCAPVF